MSNPAERVNAQMAADFAEALESWASCPHPWQPIETAPRDGTLVLVRHYRDATDDHHA